MYRSGTALPALRRPTRLGQGPRSDQAGSLPSRLAGVTLAKSAATVIEAAAATSPRVRCCQKLVAIWAQINDFEMSRATPNPVVLDESRRDYADDHRRKQDIRIRLSRDILTKEIDWDLTFATT